MRVLLLGVLLVVAAVLVQPAKGFSEENDSSEMRVILQELRALRTIVEKQQKEINYLKGKVLKSEEQLSQASTNGRSKPSSAQSSEALLRAAQDEIAASEANGETEDVTFTSGALGLQALNPEISITGDLLGSYHEGAQVEKSSDFKVRGLGIHFESYLDPYTRFKAAVSANDDTTKLGEAYLTRFGVLPDLNVTLGKFRQDFGVVNRWHKHALDQVDFPLPLRMIFGGGGLNQSGISLNWQVPFFKDLSQEVIFQITDGGNKRVFGENEDNFPSFLARLKNYHDISKSTYIELGLSALAGRNDTWQINDADGVGDSDAVLRVEERDLWANVLGADLTLFWEPVDRMRYRNVTWRSEAYWLNKDILSPDASGKDTISAWGAYSYVESKVSRTFYLGVRGDYFRPDTKNYAGVAAEALMPLVVAESNSYRWQLAPYLTWHQSPFVHFRIEYNHLSGNNTGADEDIFWFQTIFAAGPHKHERY